MHSTQPNPPFSIAEIGAPAPEALEVAVKSQHENTSVGLWKRFNRPMATWPSAWNQCRRC